MINLMKKKNSKTKKINKSKNKKSILKAAVTKSKKHKKKMKKIKFSTKKIIKTVEKKVVVKDVETPKVALPESILVDSVATEKPKSNIYFTKETEDGIVEYNKSNDAKEKDRIYNEKIRYAFEKIAENVYNTFKFSYSDVSPLEVQKQAISHMVANIDRYEMGRGKAFSYFSIVAKNWFILDNNNTYRRFTKHVEICEHPGDSGEFVIEPEHRKKETEMREFIKLMVEYWDKNVGRHFTKERDLSIANAVIEIFRNSDRIDMFNKKALYLYIRDIANCQTQHITKVINKMQITQKIITAEYLTKGTVTVNI